MRKLIYFIIQILWSLVLSTAVWYLFFVYAFSEHSDNTTAGVALFAGGVVYIIRTLVQIIAGIRKVKEWRWWVILVSVLIAAAIAFIGSLIALVGPELITRIAANL